MHSDLAIVIEGVSKKFCRRLRRSLMYGLADTTRNMLGMRSASEQLRKAEFWALHDVSLSLRRGRALGLIGANGGGKSTLLKLINAIYWPDAGQISVRGRVGALIAVGAGFHPELTGAENIRVNGAILGMSRRDIELAYDDIVDFADISDFLDAPVKYYSSGMYVRLGFAVAAFSRPDIMLVDEVLAVGDSGFQAKCFGRMAKLRHEGTTFVVVSHNMHTISGFVDEVAVVHDARLQCLGVDAGIQHYEELQRSHETAHIEYILDGTDNLQVENLVLSGQQLNPGDDLTVDIDYICSEDIEQVEVEVELVDNRDLATHVQASSLRLGTRVDLRRGSGQRLRIHIEELWLQGTTAVLCLQLWSRGRSEQLFVRRLPLEFRRGIGHGRNALPVTISAVARDDQ